MEIEEKKDSEYAGHAEWAARRGVLVVSISPGIFWVSKYWVLGAIALILLVGMYFKHSAFQEYRQSGTWFYYWLVSLTLIGVLLGLIIYLMPQYSDICRALYILTIFISIFVKRHLSKSFDKDFKGLLRK